VGYKARLPRTTTTRFFKRSASTQPSMHRFCHSCGTALVNGATCSACGTSVDSGVAPTELGNHSGAVSVSIAADKRRRVRLGLTVAALGVLLIGIVVVLANRSSPPKSSPTVDSRQDEKAMIGHGEKPSPVVKQSPEVLPPIVKPRNDSQNQVASPTQPANEEANKSKVRADGSQPRSTNSTTRSADHPSFLQFEAGVRLWIRVNSITRQPDGSFSFRGTLLQPITLAGPVSLDQSTELVGSGTVNGGHVTVSVTGFTVRGENYGLRQAASGVIRKPGSGPGVELNLGKVLEMWLVSASVYEKTRPTGD
jgi:hypothetical protein